MSYSEQVLDHFENPRNVGELPSPDAEARLEHPVCGDIMSLAVKVADGRIDQVRYRTRGCVASIAAGSCLTELIRESLWLKLLRCSASTCWKPWAVCRMPPSTRPTWPLTFWRRC